MRVIVIGGVAAGTKAAAKLKRCDRSAEVTILTKDTDISYAGCGLPYYVGGLIESREELIVNTPEKYAALTGASVLTDREVIRVNRKEKTVIAREGASGEEETYSYENRFTATGARMWSVSRGRRPWASVQASSDWRWRRIWQSRR